MWLVRKKAMSDEKDVTITFREPRGYLGLPRDIDITGEGVFIGDKGGHEFSFSLTELMDGVHFLSRVADARLGLPVNGWLDKADALFDNTDNPSLYSIDGVVDWRLATSKEAEEMYGTDEPIDCHRCPRDNKPLPWGTGGVRSYDNRVDDIPDTSICQHCYLEMVEERAIGFRRSHDMGRSYAIRYWNEYRENENVKHEVSDSILLDDSEFSVTSREEFIEKRRRRLEGL